MTTTNVITPNISKQTYLLSPLLQRQVVVVQILDHLLPDDGFPVFQVLNKMPMPHQNLKREQIYYFLKPLFLQLWSEFYNLAQF